ncbi:Sec1 family protein [Tritrichomonas foetus]|uniref:Sec1 family protein n=1 Tax=Tritrichomonas foetus TaxID=1144522 RepID=A0A1J4KWW2_9EUKA|nr:Sec1 family protein [Tritrichomonas foetus]|eukprot:OHT14029.1 Sec1 family protein [Tritrichomonas foetus]
MQNSSDLRSDARSTLQQSLTELKTKYRSTKFILVLDDQVAPIFSSLFSMSELMENNIVLVERYSLKRKPLTSYHAIYLLGPDAEIGTFMADWEKEPKYAAPHVFFTFACNTASLNKLEQAPSIVDRILTFKFLYLHFTPIDPFTFFANCPAAFNSLYSPGPKLSLDKAYTQMLHGLISFFFTIRAKPLVAYDKKFTNCANFAKKFINDMDEQMNSFPPEIQQTFNQNNTLLVIIPRGSDPVAPLLHQFTFEAMVYEHYKVEDGVYKIKPEDPHSYLSLDYYYDTTYKELRYVHMENLIDNVRMLAQPFLDLQKQQQGTPQEKTEANRKITQCRQQYDQIISAFNVCIEIVESKVTKAVMDASAYEQTMASGMKNADTKFKPSKVELSQFLSRNDINEEDKVRLLTIYAMTGKKMPPNEIQRTMQSAGIDTKYKNAAINADTIVEEIERKKKYDKEAYTTSKYIPYVSEVLHNAIDKKLHKKDFEIPESSARYQNIVLFMMGGISFMELREINEIRSKTRGMKIYVGSTGPLTPMSYVKEIGGLKDHPQ